MPEGVVLLDKPAGVSSHGALHQFKQRFPGEKIGHAGTLDPFATGLLIVLIGREATKHQARFMELPKLYRTTARFGFLSTTGDPDGELTETGKVPPDPPALPVGEIRQTTPAYAAAKVAGVRSYKRARRGESFTLPQRDVSVYRFEQLSRGADQGEYEIECSSGTYVRSLIADLGDAYCLTLRRLAIGQFTADEASEERLVPIQDALALAS